MIERIDLDVRIRIYVLPHVNLLPRLLAPECGVGNVAVLISHKACETIVQHLGANLLVREVELHRRRFKLIHGNKFPCWFQLIIVMYKEFGGNPQVQLVNSFPLLVKGWCDKIGVEAKTYKGSVIKGWGKK